MTDLASTGEAGRDRPSSEMTCLSSLRSSASKAENLDENLEQHVDDVEEVEIKPYLSLMQKRTQSYQRNQSEDKKSIRSKYIISKYRRLKINVFHFLEGPKTTVSRMYHHFVVFMILSSMGFAIAMTVQTNTDESKEQLRNTLFALEFALLLIFGAEYLLRFWSCSSHGTYAGCRGKLKYILLPHMILDVLIAASSFVLIIILQAEVEPDIFRYFVLLQLLRILRIDRQRGAFKTFHQVIKNHANELITCWYMGFIVVMFLSYLIYADPSISVKDKHATVGDLVNGVYWGIVSMTTIGYGDISPETNIAKLLLCIFALIGAGFIAMPAGIIGSGFALQVIEQQKKKHVTKRRRPAAVLIQVAWRIYASDLSKSFEATWLPHMEVRKTETEEEENRDDDGKSIKGELPKPLKPEGRSASLHSIEVNAMPNFAKEKLFKIGLIVNKMKFLEEEPKRDVEYRTLSHAEKLAVGFIRRLQYNVALRNFRQAQRPCDENDIIDKFAVGQVEILDKIHQLDTRLCQTAHESEETRMKLQDTVEILEIQIQHISRSLDHLRLALEDVGQLRADDV